MGRPTLAHWRAAQPGQSSAPVREGGAAAVDGPFLKAVGARGLQVGLEGSARERHGCGQAEARRGGRRRDLGRRVRRFGLARGEEGQRLGTHAPPRPGSAAAVAVVPAPQLARGAAVTCLSAPDRAHAMPHNGLTAHCCWCSHERMRPRWLRMGLRIPADVPGAWRRIAQAQPGGRARNSQQRSCNAVAAAAPSRLRRKQWSWWSSAVGSGTLGEL